MGDTSWDKTVKQTEINIVVNQVSEEFSLYYPDDKFLTGLCRSGVISHGSCRWVNAVSCVAAAQNRGA